MKRYLFIISVLLLSLIVVVVFINFRHCPHVFRRLSRNLLHMRYVPSADIEFRWNGVQGYNSSGPRGSTSDGSVLKSSDCVTVGWAMYRFPTAADAEAQFHEWVHSASKVLESASAGQLTDVERAVLQIDDKADFRYRFNIISKTSNSAAILSIWSRSLEHALLLQNHWQKDLPKWQSHLPERPSTLKSSATSPNSIDLGLCLL
jgi:hypothetical protein